MSNSTRSTRERLRELALEISLLAAEQEEDRVPAFTRNSKISEEEYHDTWWLREATKLRDSRRLREKYFSVYFFGEFAWNMLIDLFIEDIRGRRVSITSACIASGGPPTTALRWITLMHGDGLVERQASASDRRRTWVSLTPKGSSLIKKYIFALNGLTTAKSPELMLIHGGEAGD